MVNILDHVTHKWKVRDDWSLEIDWMDGQRASDETLLNENEVLLICTLCASGCI